MFTSSSRMVSIKVVADRYLTTSSRERLVLLKDTEESKEGVQGTHSSGSLLGMLTSIGLLGIGVMLLPESLNKSRDTRAPAASSEVQRASWYVTCSSCCIWIVSGSTGCCGWRH